MRLAFCWLVTLLCAVGLCPGAAAESAPGAFRLMSFNIWVGGEAGGQPLEQTARVIREARADIVGLQEGYGREREDGSRPNRGAELAALLEWNYADQGDGRAILSRHEMVGLSKRKHGATVRLPDGRNLHVFNVHLSAAPYQPYQLLKIEYGDAPFLSTAEELVAAAESARGHELRGALREMQPLLKAGELCVLTGDFNEPSHRDWTAAALVGRVVPMKVPYPASRRVEQAGLRDAYRVWRPDEVRYPGWTWTPTTSPEDPEDRHDRIDFVYLSPALSLRNCEIVGESKQWADIVVTPYPSDHRGVVVECSVQSLREATP